MVRNHLRSNIVGYLALFVALSGTAVALPATDTVFSDDIVDGEVRTEDISDTNGVRSADIRDDDQNGGGLTAIDLGGDSVGRSEIATDGVGSPEIELDAVRQPEIVTDGVGSPEIKADSVAASEIATDGVGGPEIELEAVGKPEIATDAVGALEIAENAVGGPEIGPDSVGKDALVVDGVGANELDEVHEHESVEVEVEDGTAHDGAYGARSVRVECLFPEEDLLSVSIEWTETNNHAERMTSNVEIVRGNEIGVRDAAIVQGAYDGGGGAANPARFIAFATCLQA